MELRALNGLSLPLTGRRTDFMKDPEVIARRQKTQARMEAAE
jgi:hypothetical protein